MKKWKWPNSTEIHEKAKILHFSKIWKTCWLLPHFQQYTKFCQNQNCVFKDQKRFLRASENFWCLGLKFFEAFSFFFKIYLLCYFWARPLIFFKKSICDKSGPTKLWGYLRFLQGFYPKMHQKIENLVQICSGPQTYI